MLNAKFFFFLLISFGLPVLLLAQIPAIKVDQIGYKIGSKKIAVLSDPQVGYNAGDSYTPGGMLEIKTESNGTVVFSGSPIIWNNGITHDQSGDKVWWFDFSSLDSEGSYFIFDPSNNISSDTFLIAEQPYQDLQKVAFKNFYYQRCGVAKSTPHCLPGYSDGACHVGALQDLNCRDINNPTVASEKNMSGGWHDAGDFNKYVNFLWSTLTNMLLSYEFHPEAWNDDMDIPESGNYIPDLLDEVKFELDWLLKMQSSSGGVHCIVGVTAGYASPPSADGSQRFYGPMTTSASYTAATVFALAALQFEKINCVEAQNYAEVLEAAAISAYDWANNNPNELFYNEGVVGAGEQEVDAYCTSMRKLSAAIYLYAKTNNSIYKTYVENNYDDAHLIQWFFVYVFEQSIQEALAYYAHLPGASSSVSNDIQNAYSYSVENSTHNLPAHISNLDAYFAHMGSDDHGWGSNSSKCQMGNIYVSYEHYEFDPANSDITNISQDYLHYINGVNPNGLMFLTNLANWGAERSINQIYHGWFQDGSPLWDEVGVSTYGPAPGILSGGPNPTWSLDDCCPNDCGSASNNALCINLSPPGNQPILKSYLDWNADWPQNSWEVTENAIYYQAAYLQLIASVVDRTITIDSLNSTQVGNANFSLSESGKGIVLQSRSDSSYILCVNNQGKLLVENSTTNTSPHVKLSEGHFNLNQSGGKIFMKSPDGSTWELGVDTDGKLAVESSSAPTAVEVEQQNGDFVLGEAGRGIVLQDVDGACYLVRVNDAGGMVVLGVECE